MKRHPSLIPLSREHHETLILARLLQKGAPEYKGLPTDSRGKADYAMKHYKNELIGHFEKEEIIIPLLKGQHPEIDLLLHEIPEEHQELHRFFQSVYNQENLDEHLDRLGKALEAHVRKEERQFFPLVQEHCSEEILKIIDKTLADIH